MFKKLVEKGKEFLCKCVKPVVTVVAVVVAAVVSTVKPAAAVLDLSGVTFDTAPIEAYALVIIGALAVMWVIRKAIKTTNRS